MRQTVVGALLGAAISLSSCATTGPVFREGRMDFSSIEGVAILPLANLTRERAAAERVRDVLANALLATGVFRVVPLGEVSRGLSRVGIEEPSQPAPDTVVKLARLIEVDAMLTGTVREYGELRSGSASANVISLSLQLYEAQTGSIVWSASVTRGGVGVAERLLGGGGAPMNTVTEEAVDDLVDALFE